MDKIENSVILITGADGGIGNALLNECIRRKARKIYATGLSTKKLQQLADQNPDKIIPLQLDVTDEASIQKAVASCTDLNFLINNAGVELKSSFIGADVAQKALFEMKVNYIGVLSLINGFLPHLTQNAPSCIMNILSVGSGAVVRRLATYCASKTATHLMTQTIREELVDRQVSVVGVYPGYVDTSMSSDIDFEKASPEELSIRICDSFEAGISDIFPDKMSSRFYEAHPIAITYLD